MQPAGFIVIIGINIIRGTALFKSKSGIVDVKKDISLPNLAFDIPDHTYNHDKKVYFHL